MPMTMAFSKRVVNRVMRMRSFLFKSKLCRDARWPQWKGAQEGTCAIDKCRECILVTGARDFASRELVAFPRTCEVSRCIRIVEINSVDEALPFLKKRTLLLLQNLLLAVPVALPPQRTAVIDGKRVIQQDQVAVFEPSLDKRNKL